MQASRDGLFQNIKANYGHVSFKSKSLFGLSVSLRWCLRAMTDRTFKNLLMDSY